MILLALIASSLWAFRENYQVLFSDLNGQDAAAMVNELERLKVPYQLEDDGSTILVPHDVVYKTRLKLMGKGVNLQGSVGFEIFNNAEFGMTEFAQKVNYQRALQGELARTIMGFDEIKSARVHLVLPESGLFKHQNAKPKASVSVVMKADAVLGADQISGIQRLVAASVPEVDPNEVTVMDQRGMAVSKLSSNDGEAKMHERLDLKEQLEDYMTRKIIAVVDKAVGPGKAIVSVDATLNYDQMKVLKEEIVPLPNTSGQEVGAITRRKETTQNNDFLYGAEANQSKHAMRGIPNSSSAEVEFSNSKRVEQILSAQGNILKLNVGVLVPDTYDRVKIEKLKEVIAMTAGISSARGDGLAVYAIDLPNSEEKKKEATVTEAPVTAQAPITKSATNPPKKVAMIVLGLMAGLGVIVMAMRRRYRTSSMMKLPIEERTRLLHEISQWANTHQTL